MVTPSLDSTLPVSLTYMVSDGNGATATANLTVHVRQSNQFYNLISRTYGGSVTDSASSIVQTTDGGFYVGGYASSSDGDVTSNSGGKDFWLVRLNQLGDIVWQKNYGGSADESVNSIKLTTDGGCVMAKDGLDPMMVM